MLLDSSVAFVPLGAPLSVVGATGLTFYSGVIDLLGAGVGVAPPNIIGRATVFGTDFGIGEGKPLIDCAIGTALVTGDAATLTVIMQGAPDSGTPTYQPGTWQTLVQSPAITAAQGVANAIIARFDWPPVFPTGANIRYMRLGFATPTGTQFSAGTIAYAIPVLARDDISQIYATSTTIRSLDMPPRTDTPAIPADEVESIIEREVRARVAREVERVLPEMAAHWAKPGAMDGSAENMMQGLAMAIAQLTDQGNGRMKRLPPDVLVARQEAHDRMIARIKLAQKNAELPVYELMGKVLLEDKLIQPVWIDEKHRQRQEEIGWRGIPNSVMKPVNDVAKEIFADYLKWVGEDVVKVPVIDRVTAGGLVMMRQNEGPEPGPSRSAFGVPGSGDLMVMRDGAAQPSMRPVRVLGSVAEPAREQVA